MVKRGGIVLLFSILLVLTFLVFVYAGAFSVLPASMTFNQTTSNLYNITVNNTAVNVNITGVNVTFSSALILFGTGTSGTSALAMFTNTTTVLSWANSTWLIKNQTVRNFWFNVSVATPGNYNLTITTIDSAAVTNSTNITIQINDTAAPDSINFVSPTLSNGANLSQSNFPVNVTATDNAGISTITIYLYNATGGLVNNTNIHGSPAFINFTNLSDGNYYVNATANDTTGNQNLTSATIHVLLDTAIPSLTLISPLNNSVVTSSYMDFVFNASDTNIASPGGCDLFFDTDTNGVDYYDGIDLSSGTNTSRISGISDGLHNWTVWCYDIAGNLNTSETRFFIVNTTVAAPPSSGGGSGTTGYWYVNYYPTDSQAAAGYTHSVIVHSQIEVKVSGVLHSVGVVSLTGTSAVLNVSSTTQQATLNIGDEKKFDVNGDGYYDLDVKLNSITGSMASLTVKTINEQIVQPSTTSVGSEATGTAAGASQDNGVTQPAVSESISLSKKIVWIVLAVVIVIIVALVIWYILSRGKKPNKYLLIKRREK